MVIQVVFWVELLEQRRLCPIFFFENMDPDKWDTTVWYWVTRNPQEFCGLMGGQRDPQIWDITKHRQRKSEGSFLTNKSIQNFQTKVPNMNKIFPNMNSKLPNKRGVPNFQNRIFFLLSSSFFLLLLRLFFSSLFLPTITLAKMREQSPLLSKTMFGLIQI